MQPKKIWNAVREAYARYDRFMEKQGFGIVLAVCVLIIGASAAYTFYFREQLAGQTVILEDSAEPAGVQEMQTLAQAQELVSSHSAIHTAAPKTVPFSFAQPVEGFLDRDYSMLEPQYFAQANYYRLHPGIDLQAPYGTTVHSCASGRVMNVWQDHELGLCIRIRHERGYEAVYAGLSDAGYVQAGDPVAQSQIIGHVGNGVLAEKDAEPHLHLEVWLNETPVDPVELFLGILQ